MSRIEATEVKTFQVKMMCDCGGEMVATGEAFMTAPPRYGHRCQKCGETTTVSGMSYPAIQYRVAGSKSLTSKPGG